MQAGSHVETAPEAPARRSGQSDSMPPLPNRTSNALCITAGPKAPRHHLKEGEPSDRSDRRAYAVVVTRLKHRLECRLARAFAPGDQGRAHLKRMDSNSNPARRATPWGRRSLSGVAARPAFSTSTTSARPKAPSRYRRARRKRPLLFRRPQRPIGSVAKRKQPP